jgi:soluble lytic murein transglycosylase-like protein
MKLSRIHAKIVLALVLALMLVPVLALADISREAQRHQRELTRNARAVWGMSAPVAVFAAQIHQESRWHADAQSTVGAQGVAQFMPQTAMWISGAYKLGEPQPYNTGWALRALVTYDRYLWQRVTAASPCDRMAMTLSAYNGGLGWVYRDQELAAKKGADRSRWFGSIEKFNAGRSADNFAQNRDYPQVILLKWQPIYVGWGGNISC